MAYDERLADRMREILCELPNLHEKEMMGGLVFMHNDKMCVGIIKDELMCRVDPLLMNELVEKEGCRQMDFVGRPMKGYIVIEPSSIKSDKELARWIQFALDFNQYAKSSKKKISK